MAREIIEKYPLRQLNTWLVGGAAEHICFPESENDIRFVLEYAHSHKLKVTVLSGGSNVLVADKGISGLVINLRQYSGFISIQDGEFYEVAVKAGTSKSEILKFYLKRKLDPAIFLAGIPGDVGGGVVMNAGVSEAIQPREFTEIVDWIDVISLEPPFKTRRYAHRELTWSYRHCEGWRPGIISMVGLKCPNRENNSVIEIVRQANRIRLQKQPLDMPSCGSVFVNPPGHKAAQLIDSCGLKGFQIGGAQVSTKHANFIVNTGTATAVDISDVIVHVQKVVMENTQVALTTEVIRLGEW